MDRMKISEIEKVLFAGEAPSEATLELFKHDERAGVQRLLTKWNKKKLQEKHLHEQFFNMTEFERKYKAEGYKAIVGIDEAGRGPLAGPVVAAAVVLPDDFYLPGLNDSKKLSSKKREDYFHFIQEQALAVGVGIISASVIDEVNILQATKKAMLDAVSQLRLAPDFLLIDAVKLETSIPFESLIKGDARSISIAAASIIAKVTRDRIMREIGLKHPEYGFENHMGYGTSEHLQAMKTFGTTEYHRKSFAPVKAIQDK